MSKRKPRKQDLPEQVFLTSIKKLIRNMLIDNPNYTSTHYNNKSVYHVIEDTKERAEYILERIDEIDHLVDSSYYKELEKEV